MQRKDPKPEIMRLEEVAIMVKSGDIKLPKFQRPFVWKRPDMLKLLDSIYKGYPIGSILIWNSSQKLISERSIAGLSVDVDEMAYYPTNYLLDGQQRLTTLCGALFWDGLDSNSVWNIQFDLEREEFVYPKDQNLPQLFPLNKLVDTGAFIRQCMRYGYGSVAEKYVQNAERLLKSIKDYKIAVVKIGDMTIDEVAPIFERINSTGRKLTMVDLMMAATWSERFDLSLQLEAIKALCKDEGFEEISDAIILRSISAAAGLGINKEDIQRLRAKSSIELMAAVEAVRIAMRRSLTFMRDVLHVEEYSYIPYGLQLTHLVEYFRIVGEPSQNEIIHLQNWFWYTSCSLYFSGANSGQNSADLARTRAYAHRQSEVLFDSIKLDITHFLFDKFNLRNASSTTFALTLNISRPAYTIDERAIDGGHLKVKSGKYYASCIPRTSKLSELNVSRVIYPYGDRQPIISEESQNLVPNHLDLECAQAAGANDWVHFIARRAGIFAEVLTGLTGCRVEYTIPNTLISELVFDEADDLED